MVSLNEISMSRLDRVVVAAGWQEEWGQGSFWVFSRDVFNHFPIVLKYSSHLRGPKPFRFTFFVLGMPIFR